MDIEMIVQNYRQCSNKYYVQISYQTHFDMVRFNFQTN
jgi:hypothetical protein